MNNLLKILFALILSFRLVGQPNQVQENSIVATSTVDFLKSDNVSTIAKVVYYYKQGQRRRVGITDNNNNILLEPIYDNIYNRFENYFIVQLNGKYGVFDANKNKLALEIKYSSIDIDHNYYKNDCYIKVYLDGKCMVLDKNYDVLIKYKFEDVVINYYSIFPNFIVRNNNLEGIYNIKLKKIVIPIEFEYVNIDANENAIIVKKNNKFGLYTLDYKQLLQPIYSKILNDNEGDYIFSSDQNPSSKGIVNTYLGKTTIPPIYSDVFKYYNKEKEGYFIIVKGKKYGFMNKNGSILLDTLYSHISSNLSNSNYIFFRVDNKYGVFNVKSKRIVIPSQFDEIKDTQGGVFIILNNNKFGLIDSSNHILLNWEYDNIQAKSNSFFEYIKEGKRGLYSISRGNSNIPMEYDEITPIGYEHILAKKKNSYSLYDPKGKLLFKNLTQINEIPTIDKNGGHMIFPRKLVIKEPDKHLTIYDWHSDSVLDSLNIDNIKYCYNDSLYIGIRNKKYGLVDEKNKDIIPFNFESLEFTSMDIFKYDSLSVTKLRRRDIFVLAKKDNFCGVLDLSNNEILSLKFQHIESLNGFFFKAQLNNKYYIFNSRGKQISEIGFDYVGKFEPGRWHSSGWRIQIGGKNFHLNTNGKITEK